MEIKINIEKKYVFLILIAIFAVGGFVIAQSQSVPNPGHSVNQIYGAAPNCGTGSPISAQDACNINLRSIVGNNLDQGVGYAGIAAYSRDSDKLDNIDSTGFCQTGGAGCPISSTFQIRSVTLPSFGQSPWIDLLNSDNFPLGTADSGTFLVNIRFEDFVSVPNGVGTYDMSSSFLVTIPKTTNEVSERTIPASISAHSFNGCNPQFRIVGVTGQNPARIQINLGPCGYKPATSTFVYKIVKINGFSV